MSMRRPLLMTINTRRAISDVNVDSSHSPDDNKHVQDSRKQPIRHHIRGQVVWDIKTLCMVVHMCALEGNWVCLKVQVGSVSFYSF